MQRRHHRRVLILVCFEDAGDGIDARPVSRVDFVRKLTAGLFITLDGVIEAPEKCNPPGRGRHRQAPIRRSHRPGAAQAPRIQAPQQWRRRAPLRSGPVAATAGDPHRP